MGSLKAEVVPYVCLKSQVLTPRGCPAQEWKGTSPLHDLMIFIKGLIGAPLSGARCELEVNSE